MRAFRDIGVPAELVEATDAALSITRAVICLMLPLLWSAWLPERTRSTAKLTAPPSAPMVSAVPVWTFDKHTSLGKAAITRFAAENDEVRSTLARWARPDAARDAACMAAFYADAIPISPRLDWSRSVPLENEGRRVDMWKVGVPWDGVGPIIEAVRDNLDHLNEIRARLLRRAPAPARSEP